ncbi:MAG: FtsB family cell division protein [Terriglobia bacterium]
MKGIDWHQEGFRRGAILATVFVLVALVLHGIYGSDGLVTLYHKRRELKTVAQHIQQLKHENLTLQREVQNLRSNPATIERYAREELHMARHNEIIYMLPQKARSPADPANNTHPSKP